MVNLFITSKVVIKRFFPQDRVREAEIPKYVTRFLKRSLAIEAPSFDNENALSRNTTARQLDTRLV